MYLTQSCKLKFVPTNSRQMPLKIHKIHLMLLRVRFDSDLLNRSAFTAAKEIDVRDYSEVKPELPLARRSII